MAQKKHKKRKHNTSSATAAQQASVSSEETQAKAKPTRAEKKQAREKAKAEEAKRENKAELKAKGGKPSRWERFKTYWKNVRTEMQRVVWPTRKELINASLIVIGALVFFGVYIAIIDNVVIIPLDWIASLGD